MHVIHSRADQVIYAVFLDFSLWGVITIICAGGCPALPWVLHECDKSKFKPVLWAVATNLLSRKKKKNIKCLRRGRTGSKEGNVMVVHQCLIEASWNPF